MKKFLTLAMSFLTAAVCVTAAGCNLFGGGSKDTVTDDGITYKLTSDDTYQVVGFKDEADSRTELKIPDTVKKKSVTVIGSNAFKNNSKLKRVTIPDSVTEIYNQAFAFCTSLEELTVGEGLKRMYEGVFGKCEKLKKVNISDLSGWCGVDYSDHAREDTYYGLSNPLSYGAKLYLNGSLITDLVIPDDVTRVEGFTFAYCSGIETVKLHSNVNYITAAAFTGSTLKSYNVDESNGMYSGEGGILYNKPKTEIIHVPDNLEGSVVVPDTVSEIAAYTFSNRDYITDITLGSGVRVIKAYAFFNCGKLEYIVLQKGVTEIQSNALDEDDNIRYTGTRSEFDRIRIYTPAGMQYNFPSESFKNAKYDYKINSGTPSQEGTGNTGTGTGGSQSGSGTGVTVTLEDLDKFWFEPIYGTFGDVVGYEVHGDAPLQVATSVIVPYEYNGKPVIRIGENAFSDYATLRTVTIPSSITQISMWAFAYSNITSVIFQTPVNWYTGVTWDSANSGTNPVTGLQNSSTAATLLTQTYPDVYWVRK